MPNIVIEAEVLDADEQAALSAQTKINQAIATSQVEILKRIQRLEKLGGEQDYSYTIIEALNAFNGQVNLSFLSLVLPDHALLTAARKALVEAGKIHELQEKNRKILKLATAA